METQKGIQIMDLVREDFSEEFEQSKIYFVCVCVCV